LSLSQKGSSLAFGFGLNGLLSRLSTTIYNTGLIYLARVVISFDMMASYIAFLKKNTSPKEHNELSILCIPYPRGFAKFTGGYRGWHQQNMTQ